MKEKLRQIFAGRQGMDELSKLLFWAGIVLLGLSAFLGGSIGSVLSSFGLMGVILAFVRAFSRNLPMREAENRLLLRWAGATSISSAPAAGSGCACPGTKGRSTSAAAAAIRFTGRPKGNSAPPFTHGKRQGAELIFFGAVYARRTCGCRRCGCPTPA